ncbi:lipopolysaccharide assembly protein LapB [Kordiimonas sp. SCSIO 12610]|uniref:tetratricopeptide repeat protein n=1 Tax=Kordiimonas sp. SCSIO 12610 TaxID=2829597 RepID=UPI00210D3C9F|nr:hypothetical protein [Kordiimonas sp. SCSIO 12610]UTW56080.1 hypothetical protein KFF44_04075 [Kordiimonas sp. SCSIO 12610]
MMKTVFKLFAAVILLSNQALYADDEWHELISDHFILRTDTNLEKAKETIEKLEKYRFTIGAITNADLSADYSPPLVVYAFEKTKRFRRVFGITGGTAGFYIPFEDGAISMLTLEEGDETWSLDGLRVLFHEYSHHILHQYSPLQYPRWYDEGFGEYLAMTDFDGDKVIIGRPAVHRFPNLKSPGSWLKLETLLQSKGEYIGAIGGATSRKRLKTKNYIFQQYSQGWLTTHFFQSSDKYQKKLNAYLQGINRPGSDIDKEFKKAFGKSYAKMDKEIKRYWYNRELPSYVIDLKGQIPEIEYKVRKLNEHEVKIMEPEARYLAGGSAEEIADHIKVFEEALSNDVRPADLNLYLAELALRSKDWDKAEHYINILLAEKSDHAPALTLKTELMKRGKQLKELAKDQQKAVRKATITALKADQTYVPGLMAYARLFMEEGTKVTDNALDVMETVRFLVPDVDSAKILQVRMLAKAGKVADAKAHAQKLIDWASSSRQRKRYEDLLEEVEEKATLTASAN